MINNTKDQVFSWLHGKIRIFTKMKILNVPLTGAPTDDEGLFSL